MYVKEGEMDKDSRVERHTEELVSQSVRDAVGSSLREMVKTL